MSDAAKKTPPRKFDAEELVVASHNEGKLRELRELFGDRVKKLTNAADYGLDSPAETGTTFLENALLKAQYVAEKTGKVAISDDSGLCVAALDGAPGVYSADWAEEEGKPRDFAMAAQKIHRAMAGNPDTAAHYVSCLVLAWPDGHYEAVEGYAHGNITWPPRGSNGFGYDPIFVPKGDTRTYGEMTAEEKNETNHRADSFRKMLAKCF